MAILPSVICQIVAAIHDALAMWSIPERASPKREEARLKEEYNFSVQSLYMYRLIS